MNNLFYILFCCVALVLADTSAEAKGKDLLKDDSGLSLGASVHVGPVSVGIDSKSGAHTAIHVGPVFVEKGEHEVGVSVGVEVGVGPVGASAVLHPDGDVTVGAGLGVHAGIVGVGAQVKYTVSPEKIANAVDNAKDTFNHPFNVAAREDAKIRRSMEEVRETVEKTIAESNQVNKQWDDLVAEYERWSKVTKERGDQLNSEAASIDAMVVRYNRHFEPNECYMRGNCEYWNGRGSDAIECCYMAYDNCGTCLTSNIPAAGRQLQGIQNNFNERMNSFRATSEREQTDFVARISSIKEKKNAIINQMNSQINFMRKLRQQQQELGFDRMMPPMPNYPPPPLPTNL